MIKDAVVLAGGFGTRLRPLTQGTPKPLLPLGGRPFLETLFARLAQAGVKRVVLSAQHQAAKMKRALPGLRRFGLRVELRREPRPLGTGGGIRYAWPDPAKPCLVLNGDILSDLDIRPLLAAHRRSRAVATLWVIPVEETSAFGVLETGAQGRVRRFVEKPRPGETSSRLINAGLYALQPAVLDAIPVGQAVSVEREVFPELLARGLDLRAYAAPKPVYWNDIGTPASYLQAHLDLLNQRLWGGRGLALRLWGRQDRRGNLVAPGCRVAADALVSQSVLGKGCRIGAGARIEASVLLDRVGIGAMARVQRALLGPGVRIGERSELRPGVVLGPGSRLADDSRA
jgi:NDP-sugar pyrophosphorylase family protein